MRLINTHRPLAAAIALAALSACGSINPGINLSTDPDPAVSTPPAATLTARAKAFAAVSLYRNAQAEARAYSELPWCGQPLSPVLCAKPEIVIRIDDVNQGALPIFEATERAAVAADGDTLAWLAAAEPLLTRLEAILGEAAADKAVKQAVADGEVVAVGGAGKPSKQRAKKEG